MPESAPLISAVIVSYNTCALTLDCLTALYADLGDTPAEVFVVDNASTDSSVEAIRLRFSDVRIIANMLNRGFGAANNQALKLASGKFLLLLNSDAFLKPGAVQSLLAAVREHPRIGVVGPRLLNRDGSLQRSCFRFPSPFRAWVENLWLSTVFARNNLVGDYRRWPHDVPRHVDWLVGACILVRRDVFEQVGGFDEKFFMYAEESDWQKRIREAGWSIVFTPEAQVVHLGGASGSAHKPKINRHFFESLDYYEYKHHGIVGLIALRAAMVVGCFMRMFAWSAVYMIRHERREAASAKLRLLSWLIVRQSTCWRLSL